MKVGLVEKAVRFSGAQAEGLLADRPGLCRAATSSTPVKPNTIAKSCIGNPADGPTALDIASRTGGSIAAVNDEEIIEGSSCWLKPRVCSLKPLAAPPLRCSRSWWSRARSTSKPPLPASGSRSEDHRSGGLCRWWPLTIDPQLADFNAAWERAQSLQRATWDTVGVELRPSLD